MHSKQQSKGQYQWKRQRGQSNIIAKNKAKSKANSKAKGKAKSKAKSYAKGKAKSKANCKPVRNSMIVAKHQQNNK